MQQTVVSLLEHDAQRAAAISVTTFVMLGMDKAASAHSQRQT